MKNDTYFKRRWKAYGIIYFTIVFLMAHPCAYAYIDPSVTTYAIQAVAGVIVAAGAFFATYGRQAKKWLMRQLDIDESEGKTTEPTLEVYRDDLQVLLSKKRAECLTALATTKEDKKPRNHSRLLTSLLCGLGFAMTCVLRPITSFYLANEGEFWFSLGSVTIYVLLIFAITVLVLTLVHFILPGKGKNNPRLFFGAFVAAVTLCLFIQNHFMSSYLPLLTGDAIDWGMYFGWHVGSIVLWGVTIITLILIAKFQPRLGKMLVYLLFALILCSESLTCGIGLITAKHENKKETAYFSSDGLYETSEAGNVVLLISDTFEATYMNRILERYPEYRDMLSDCTFYDNMTGVSCFTYFSYANIMTGKDFPLGATSETGISNCFHNQTTIDRVSGNDWDIAYYTTFSPTANVSTKLLNYSDNLLTPDPSTAWKIANSLFKSTLFQSMPHGLKKHFIVYTQEYEEMKALMDTYEIPDPYVVSDATFYGNMASDQLNLTIVQGKPRYTLIQLDGVHEPCNLDANYNTVVYDESVSIEERKIQGSRAQLKLLRAFLDQLKQAGTYDQTTVIMTADHGYNMRFYPVFLVKEARRKDKEFRIDNTPLSMREDYEELLYKVTSGESFSEAVTDLSVSSDRTRYALDYSSLEGYGKITDRRSLVTISGDASKEDSYRIGKDEFLIDNAFGGRVDLIESFISATGNHPKAAIYGLKEGKSFGHSVVIDMFLSKETSDPLVMKLKIRNVTDQKQRIVFSQDGEMLCEETIGGNTVESFSIDIPSHSPDRITFEIDLPEAVLRKMDTEVLGWNSFRGIEIMDGRLYPKDYKPVPVSKRKRKNEQQGSK